MSLQKEQDIYVFTVTAGSYPEPAVTPYRVIALRGRSTLYTVARTILRAFNFDCDHLFGFYDNLLDWTASDDVYDFYYEDVPEEQREKQRFSSIPRYREAGRVKEARVQEVFNEIGKKMLFLYDYGDEWHFFVEVKDKRPREKGVKYPAVVESYGKVRQYRTMGDEPENFEDPYQTSLDECVGVENRSYQTSLDECTGRE